MLKNRKALQEWLVSKGQAVTVDGAIGPKSKQALVKVLTNKKATKITELDWLAQAARLGDYSPIRLKAVAAVETRGSAWLKSGLPAILYERHIYHRYDRKRSPLHKDFNWPESGNYTTDANKNGENDSIEKLINACAYDPMCAFMAVSMGAFQIMGFHYKALGYDTPWEMLYDFNSGELPQIKGLVAFMKSVSGQDEFLKMDSNPENCRDYARLHNGKRYEKNNYHVKLATEIKRLSKK